MKSKIYRLFLSYMNHYLYNIQKSNIQSTELKHVYFFPTDWHF